MPFGRNMQHDAFRAKVDKERGDMDKAMGQEEKPEDKGSMGKTEIAHHADGSASVMHADGEKSEHPSMGHALMKIHAKHEDGPAHLMHVHDGGVTTHHVEHDGEPQGPTEHPDVESAAEHAKETMGGGESMDSFMPDHEMMAPHGAGY